MIKEVRVDKIDPKTMRWVEGDKALSIVTVRRSPSSIWVSIIVTDGATRSPRMRQMDDMVKVEVSE